MCTCIGVPTKVAGKRTCIVFNMEVFHTLQNVYPNTLNREPCFKQHTNQIQQSGCRILTLQRVAVSIFLHQKAGPQLHCSIPSSIFSAPGHAPNFCISTSNTHSLKASPPFYPPTSRGEPKYMTYRPLIF